MFVFAAQTLLPLLAAEPGKSEFSILPWVLAVIVVLFLLAIPEMLGIRYIPNNRVGIVEKLWSASGSVPEGRIMALNGEAGYQVDLLRGGFHFRLWRWQYRIHKVNLVTVPQGKIGYVYARDGEPLEPSQTLGRVAHCNNFQDAGRFLLGEDEQDDVTTHRPARPATRHPSRRRLRHQPRPLRRHLRGCRLPAQHGRPARDRNPARLAERAAQSRRLQPGGRRRSAGGAAKNRWTRAVTKPRRRNEPLEVEPVDRSIRSSRLAWTASASSPCTTAPRWPPARSSPRPSATTATTRIIHNNFQDPEAFLARRRPPRPAVRPAHRRHLLHQPLVRHASR